MPNRVLGVIGGSGIYELPGLAEVRQVEVQTPYGAPSGALVIGRLGDAEMVFLARHGAGHRLLPHEINYRANLYALKQQGVEWLLSVSAVGSLREHIRPGDIVVVDQFIDRTHGRERTFFGDGIAAHVSLADPVSAPLAALLADLADERMQARGGTGRVHRGGTYVVIDGPQFSTRAESHMFRAWGADVIGMTNMPEARLAREAQISYATLALVTDFDCWREGEEAVTVSALLEVMRANADFARDVIAHVPARLPAERDCAAATALSSAILTPADTLSASQRERLAVLAGK